MFPPTPSLRLALPALTRGTSIRASYRSFSSSCSVSAAATGSASNVSVQSDTSADALQASASGSAGELDFNPTRDVDQYPSLPWVSAQRRTPGGWWDNQERKNFGETLHEQEDALSMWAPDIHKTPASSALLQMSLAFGAVATFGWFISTGMGRTESKASKRSYPFGGLKEELAGAEGSAARAESTEDEE